jgi:hypothetical protein
MSTWPSTRPSTQPIPDTTLDDFRRAQVFFDAGQPAEAARLLDEVVAADGATTAALELRARALFASAQLGRAEQAFRELVERRRTTPGAAPPSPAPWSGRAAARRRPGSGASPRRSPAERRPTTATSTPPAAARPEGQVLSGAPRRPRPSACGRLPTAASRASLHLEVRP